jgi:hypothetical protein
MNREEINKSINQAFQNVPRPDDRALAWNAEDIETPYILANFGGKKSLEFDDLCKAGVGDFDGISSMTPEAIHYFLPCFLRYSVNHVEDGEFVLVAGLISFLNLDQERKFRKYPTFNDEQRSAILQTLLFMKRNFKKYALGVFREEYEPQLDVTIQQWQAS